MRGHLLSVKQHVQMDSHNQILLDGKQALVSAYRGLLGQERDFYRQKSRVSRMKDGDTNTSFFHNSILVRNALNGIRSLQLPDGSISKCQDEISMHMVNFYRELLGTNPHQRAHAQEEIISLGALLSGEDEILLCRDVSYEKIKNALWGIGNFKAPGLDGFNAKFFKQNWALVGDDFTTAVSSFFSFGKMAKQFGSSVLPSLISPLQYAFVAGRSIIDNVLVAHELVRSYHKDLGEFFCACKIDLKKAYDSVQWDLVEEVLLGLQFLLRFIGWVMACLRCVSYSLMINGSLEANFIGSGAFVKGIPCLLYDLFLYCKGDERSIRWLKDQLYVFSNVSGLCVNEDKSSIFLSGGDKQVRDNLIRCSGFWEGSYSSRRLQLISSILRSMQVYWCLLFLISKAVWKIVDDKCRSFLWVGAEGSKKSHVSWRSLCFAKNEGGLGISDLVKWNIAAFGKQIWLKMVHHFEMTISHYQENICRTKEEVLLPRAWLTEISGSEVATHILLSLPGRGPYPICLCCLQSTYIEPFTYVLYYFIAFQLLPRAWLTEIPGSEAATHILLSLPSRGPYPICLCCLQSTERMSIRLSSTEFINGHGLKAS
ncbi:uncharacterized protein [Rutidosis leptorrhynchoides]|uniref:uncharacterized protein n=1 Tax=Rutidosis leptorrhynchoides TaxID=125765 RepID=UPI003A99B0D1